MALFDKISNVAKSIGDKTGDAIETTKLNSKIKSEKEAASEVLVKIGEAYYQRYLQGQADPEMVEMLEQAKAHYDAAAAAQEEIDRIKAENAAPAPAPAPVAPAPAPAPVAPAPAPAAPVPQAPVAPAPAPQASGVFCTQCGTANPAGTRFCSGCGNKLGEAPAPAAPVCPGCGAEVQPGTKFCNQCGHPI